MNDLERYYVFASANSPEYQEALKIINLNSTGKVWLIGGFLFRTIARELYGTAKPEVDLDFIIEKPLSNIELPSSWEISINHFGNTKLSGPHFSVDFIPLNNIFSIQERNLLPTIENFLTGVPLTVQSLAFEVQANHLQGEAGIEALKTKTVGVNNKEQAASYAERCRTTVEAYIRDKAVSLGFNPTYE